MLKFGCLEFLLRKSCWMCHDCNLLRGSLGVSFPISPRSPLRHFPKSPECARPRAQTPPNSRWFFKPTNLALTSPGSRAACRSAAVLGRSNVNSPANIGW